MKNLQHVFLILLLLTIHTRLKSQTLTFGATGNVGFSKLALEGYPDSINYQAGNLPAGSLGLYLERNIGEKSSVGIEALGLLLGGQVTIGPTPTIDAQGLETGTSIFKTNTLLGYLGLPVYYRFSTKKLGIKLGVQPMWKVFNNNRSTLFINPTNNTPPSSFSIGSERLYFDDFNIGLKGGFDYQIFYRIILRFDYYYGLNNLLADGAPVTQRNKYFSVGLNYIIRQYGAD